MVGMLVAGAEDGGCCLSVGEGVGEAGGSEESSCCGCSVGTGVGGAATLIGERVTSINDDDGAKDTIGSLAIVSLLSIALDSEAERWKTVVVVATTMTTITAAKTTTTPLKSSLFLLKKRLLDSSLKFASLYLVLFIVEVLWDAE